LAQEPRSRSPWRSVPRKNPIPLTALCYLLVVLIAGEVVTHYNDSLAALAFTWVAALPGVIALLMWLGWRDR
jgi:hypothetical protein